MWYICRSKANEPNVAYAESVDGLAWTKPNLGIVDFGGNKRNNLVGLTSLEGVVFRDPNAPEAERYAWIGFYPQANEDGIAISGVVPGGPAEGAGLLRGDLLVSVDGQPVRTLRQLYRLLWRRVPGETVGMQVLREETIQVFEIVAGDRYEFFK